MSSLARLIESAGGEVNSPCGVNFLEFSQKSCLATTATFRDFKELLLIRRKDNAVFGHRSHGGRCSLISQRPNSGYPLFEEQRYSTSCRDLINSTLIFIVAAIHHGEPQVCANWVVLHESVVSLAPLIIISHKNCALIRRHKCLFQASHAQHTLPF